MDNVFAVLSSSFARKAILVAFLAGGSISILGAFLNIKGANFLGAALAHTIFSAGALAYLLGLPVFPVAFFSAITVSFLSYFLALREGGTVERTSGLLFTFTMALGILFVSLMKRYDPSVMALLFGDILTAGTEDIVASLITAVLTFVGFVLLWRKMVIIFQDREFARVIGIKVVLIEVAFLSVLSLASVSFIKGIGALLFFAFLFSPPATSSILCRGLSCYFISSLITGIVASVSGTVLSFVFDIPSGPAIVLILMLFYFSAWIFNYLKGLRSQRG